MSNKENNEYARRHAVWVAKQEKKWVKRVYKALQVNNLSFANYAKINGLTPAIKVIDTVVEMKPIVEVLRALYLSVGIERANIVRREIQLDSKKGVSDFLDIITDAILNFFSAYAISISVMSILRTQKKTILAYILKARNSGMSDEQIINSIDNILPAITPPVIPPPVIAPNAPIVVPEPIAQITPIETPIITAGNLDQIAVQGNTNRDTDIIRGIEELPASKNQARVITQTEITRVKNYAAYVGADVTNILLDKIWICRLDNLVRRKGKKYPWDHFAPHGQTVPLELPFTVSGEALMYPGDPTASKGNIEGCRCVMKFKPRRGANGLVLPKPIVESRGITVIQPGPSNITQIITIGFNGQ